MLLSEFQLQQENDHIVYAEWWETKLLQVEVARNLHSHRYSEYLTKKRQI